MIKSMSKNKEYYLDESLELYLSDEEITEQLLINGAVVINTRTPVIYCPDILYRKGNLFKRVGHGHEDIIGAGIKYCISPVASIKMAYHFSNTEPYDKPYVVPFYSDEMMCITRDGLTYSIKKNEQCYT